jgi:hypothetical protein
MGFSQKLVISVYRYRRLKNRIHKTTCRNIKKELQFNELRITNTLGNDINTFSTIAIDLPLASFICETDMKPVFN